MPAADDMKPRRERRKEKRRELMRGAILDAARNRLLRYGIRNTTMEQVADDADLSIATVHSYYTKDALFADVVEQSLRTDEQYLDAAFDERKSAVDELIDVGRAYLNFGIDYPGYFQLVAEPSTYGPLPNKLSEQIENRVSGLVDRVAAVIDRGITEREFANDLDPKDTAVFLHGAWNGLVALSLREDRLRLSPDRLREIANLGVIIVRYGMEPRRTAPEDHRRDEGNAGKLAASPDPHRGSNP